MEVERKRRRVSCASLQNRPAGKDEAHARRTFDALARGGNQRIERCFGRIDGKRSERAHGVDDEPFSTALDRCRDLRQWIENAGRGFAVNQTHMGDARVGIECSRDVGDADRLVVWGFDDGQMASHHLGQACHALAVGAVHQCQQVPVPWNQRVDGGLDGERAASLHGHAHVAGRAVDDRGKPLANACCHSIEVAVPGTPVAQHRRFGRERRGQRSRGQEDGVSVEMAHGWTLREG